VKPSLQLSTARSLSNALLNFASLLDLYTPCLSLGAAPGPPLALTRNAPLIRLKRSSSLRAHLTIQHSGTNFSQHDRHPHSPGDSVDRIRVRVRVRVRIRVRVRVRDSSRKPSVPLITAHHCTPAFHCTVSSLHTGGPALRFVHVEPQHVPHLYLLNDI
jgi:hypothetical protein